MELTELLFNNQDLNYRDFVSKLIPNISKDNTIGVRNPIVKKIAKENIACANSFMDKLPHQYYEENILHVYFINQICDYDEFIYRINEFLPYVDNWAVCDCLRPKLKQGYYDCFIKEIDKWLSSAETYKIRFGVEMLMTFYLDEAFKLIYLDKVRMVKSDEYYVKMIVAWYFATALVKQYNDAIVYLEQRKLEKWTHKKTIQKARESYRISDEIKEYLKKLN